MDSHSSHNKAAGSKRSVEEERKEVVFSTKRVLCEGEEEEEVLDDGESEEVETEPNILEGPLVGDEVGEGAQQQQQQQQEGSVMSAAVLETLFCLAGQVVDADFSYHFDEATRARRVLQALVEVCGVQARVVEGEGGKACICLEGCVGREIFQELKCEVVEGMDENEEDFVRQLSLDSPLYVQLLVAVGIMCNQLVREKIGEQLCKQRNMFFDWSLALFTSFEGDHALRVPVLISRETIDLIKVVHCKGVGNMELTGRSLSAALCNIWRDEIRFEQIETDRDYDLTYEALLEESDCDYVVEMIVYSENIKNFLLPILEKDEKSRPLSDSSQTCTYFEFLGSMTNPCKENKKEFQLLEDFYYDDYV